MSDVFAPAVVLDLATPMRQLRFLPVQLGDQRGFLAIHSNCAGIDPWPPYFRLPADTLKLTAFSSTGERIWHRDLGPGVIPGVWFCPVYPFDLDADGTDEIFLVNNSKPDHPLDANACVLERMSAATGEIIDSHPWPAVSGSQPLSHLWRNFINAGLSNGSKRLITAQGTYGPMQLQCWDSDFNEIWSRTIKPNEPGPMGSHMFPVLDIDGDGRDELFWGERLIDIDTGEDIWIADKEGWWGHSDIIQPTLDLASGRWLIYTCRENANPLEAIGVVMFDDRGGKVWGHYGMGHVHAGWTARLNDDGTHLCYAIDVGRDKYTKSDTYVYDLAGEPVELPFDPAGTMPVDFDGDGLHELMRNDPDGSGTVIIDRHGKDLCRLEGRRAYGGKLLDLPGEQVVTSAEDGTIRIYAYPSAEDSPAAKRRYEHPFYDSCLRLWAVGYNWRNLGGL